MSDAHVDGELQCVSSPKATGADIPEELFEPILWHITHDIDAATTTIPSRHSLIRTFTSLILVCKYFARICRPTLYRKVVLRNRQQLRGLLDLLDNGCAPFGKSPVTFTQSLCIEGGEDACLWIHQLGTVLLPRMKDAGIPFPTVDLVVGSGDLFAEFKPFIRAQLPRILPSSLYQHVSKVRVENTHFKSNGLLRYLSSFRSLRSLCFTNCTCEIGAMQPTFHRPSHHLSFPKTTFADSSSLFPVMASSLLDWYARANSVPYLLHGQAEMLAVAHIMGEFRNHLPQRITEPSSMYSNKGHIFSRLPTITVEIGNRHALRFLRSSIRLTLVLRDTTHYDIVIRDSSTSGYLASEVQPVLVDCITRLPHLETLRWIFRSPQAASDFMDSSYSDLQRMLSAGQEMKVGYTFGRREPSKWESMVDILRRFAPSPKMNVLAEEQASEVATQEAMNVSETDGGDSI